ncbi:MAG: YebC/PmpR family DNA-binding transcriptional regulator [Eubacteriales bacterium]
MSGHSKWSTIKHKKGKADAKRSKIFTKLGREISVAVKQGGGSDPTINNRLRDVIAKCKAANMPNDNIERSIKKAAGEDSSVMYEEMVYEGYGLSGVAVIAEALSDNRNRTAGEVRHIFDKMGGSLGTTGCVSYMFDKKGVIAIEKSDDVDEETLFMAALEAGADDINGDDDDIYEITTTPEAFTDVSTALMDAGYTFLIGEVQMVPQTTVDVPPENVEKVTKMLEWLEDHDDINNVYHNAELDDEE